MKAPRETHFPPLARHWSAQELADAVPLRLFEVVRFASDERAASNAVTINATTSAVRPWRRQGYLPNAALPSFVRVH